MIFPKLFTQEIKDEYIQENFKRIENFFLAWPFNQLNMSFVDLTFTTAVTNYKHKHSLDFTPKDVILLYMNPLVTVTFNYPLFDATNIDITTSGATNIRFLLGRLEDV